MVRARFFGRIIVNYPGGETVSIPKGTSVLEASRKAGVPHQSVCGGRGRCTTCRIKVTAHDGILAEPSGHEIKAIERVGLDDNVRLACQLRPTRNISVQPLLNPENTLETVRSARALTGKEQETVVLFVDLRDFTKLSEKKLPYDVVYILNKYYAVCGEIIENNGGRLDKFIGDGIMAIFDASASSKVNSRNAIVRGASERNAVNAPIQGSAADIIKIAMINIHKKLKNNNYKTKMLLQVHDELVFDVFKPELEKIKSLVKSEMENAYEMSIPLEVEIDTGKNWLEAH